MEFGFFKYNFGYLKTLITKLPKHCDKWDSMQARHCPSLNMVDR